MNTNATTQDNRVVLRITFMLSPALNPELWIDCSLKLDNWFSNCRFDSNGSIDPPDLSSIADSGTDGLARLGRLYRGTTVNQHKSNHAGNGPAGGVAPMSEYVAACLVDETLSCLHED